MEIAFYVSALIAVLATIRVVTSFSPVHAVLYLIVSLLAVAMVFFALGAPFAGALEIIVYAGAIMVLFVFVIMMLQLGGEASEQERIWLQPRIWAGPSLLAALLLLALLTTVLRGDAGEVIQGELLTAAAVGSTLFGPWLMAVELAAFLLLAALVTASHVGRLERTLESGSDEGGGT
ncbi:MAG: NADH-quinone oxidoreductase subunit J [Pseudohongiellaceae bacterium]